MTEVAIALEYMHTKGIVYRDLKSENVMIGREGHVKLVDLGLAKRILNNRTLTLCGTPQYLAPEKVKGESYGIQVDIWSFGVLLFELLAGYNPFTDEENPMALFRNIRKGKINWAPYIGKEAINFIKKLLVIDPKERLAVDKFKLEPLFSVLCKS